MFKKLVIMYHFISKEGQSLLGTYPLDLKEFQNHIDLLKSKDFDFDRVSNIKKPVQQDTAYITFDDGTMDQYNFAMPFLEKNSIPAHFAICTGPFRNEYPVAHRLQVKLALNQYPALPSVSKEVEERADKIYYFEKGLRRYVKYIYNIHLDCNESDKLLGLPSEEELEILSSRFMMPEHIQNINYDLFEIGCHTKNHLPLTNDYDTYLNNEIIPWEEDMKNFCPDVKYSNVLTLPLKAKPEVNEFEFARAIHDKYKLTLSHSINEIASSDIYNQQQLPLVDRIDCNKVVEILKSL